MPNLSPFVGRSKQSDIRVDEGRIYYSSQYRRQGRGLPRSWDMDGYKPSHGDQRAEDVGKSTSKGYSPSPEQEWHTRTYKRCSPKANKRSTGMKRSIKHIDTRSSWSKAGQVPNTVYFVDQCLDLHACGTVFRRRPWKLNP